ncbi:MAG: aldose 1-epimerase family protein [Clostridia bacterium]|nr:aldose 1-epimerase family protein [Clostridia bacterium]
MTHYIENEYLKVGVKECGCELTSVFSKKNNYEYLWQGDESIWYGQAPILFPIVGRLIDDKYLLNGTEYTMPKHGFARKLNWSLLSKEEDSMAFILSESEDTLKIYPYEFDLIVTYTLSDNKLKVNHCVVNKNEDEMYFSLGAHPAFNCEIGDSLIFDANETLSTEKIDLEKSLRLPETFSILENKNEIIITENIFDEDALILHDIKSKYITLKHKNGKFTVKFDMGGSPYLGIWAKPNAPYVCIEPWFGVNDSFEKKNDFSEKDAIQKLPANEIFNFVWEAELID